MTKKMKTTLSPTVFKDAPIVAVSAKPIEDENIASNGKIHHSYSKCI